jgi:hypothetical protein
MAVDILDVVKLLLAKLTVNTLSKIRAIGIKLFF